ncbi:hypothetical protein HanXRQr2_Chr07g0314231 [Helianthus annuus]|uniref:Uncharacterized protein n=1 Tax=Helianthus annuus TaxID=4232 RepID=A0A9K3IPB7_HELAN|nr:hypothetical protein HanXRQr2_Chr07g0314231 [Helianthus annuus]
MSHSTNGLEKFGLWSLSITYTFEGGHFAIILSCCSGFKTRSYIVLMYTRLSSLETCDLHRSSLDLQRYARPKPLVHGQATLTRSR